VERKIWEKKRPCMCTKATIAQKLPHEYKRNIVEFHKYVIDMRKKLCFEIGQLGNMAEVPLIFDVPSNETGDVKGAKTIRCITLLFLHAVLMAQSFHLY